MYLEHIQIDTPSHFQEKLRRREGEKVENEGDVYQGRAPLSELPAQYVYPLVDDYEYISRFRHPDQSSNQSCWVNIKNRTTPGMVQPLLIIHKDLLSRPLIYFSAVLKSY